MELSKLAGINNQAIDLIESRQTFYGPIYSLKAMELETLKTYVKTNLTKGFIWSSKSTGVPKLISLEAANLWIAWVVSDVVFYPVGSDRRVPLEEHLWRQQFEESLLDLSRSTRVSNHAPSNTLFRATSIRALPRSLIDWTVGAIPRAPISLMEACYFHQGEDRFLKTNLSLSHYQKSHTPHLNAKDN